MKRLGLIDAPGTNDKAFRLSATPALDPVVRRVTKYWPMFNRPLDQGGTSCCVGFAAKHWQLTAPVIQTAPPEEPTATTLYLEALAHDPWPDNDWGDLQSGTSLDAGAKALRARGLLKEWRHVDTLDEILDWVCGVDANGKWVGGPLILGLPWDRSMFDTDSNGFIFPNGELEGYHAICINGRDEKRGFVRFPQSWGDQFGRKRKDGTRDGYGRIYDLELNTLLERGGHGIVMLETRLP